MSQIQIPNMGAAISVSGTNLIEIVQAGTSLRATLAQIIGLLDGDKGDITVSSGGTVFTIDNGVVTTTKMGGDVTATGKAILAYGGLVDVGTNVAAQQLGTYAASKVTISADTTLTTTVPAAGLRATVLVFTSGTTTRTVTFGTGFKSQGTLATGATASRYWCVSFISDGTNLIETGRTTTAIA